MFSFALNHMTVARSSFTELLDISLASGCAGVEIRNDLAGELFGGLDPVAAGQLAMSKGLTIYAIAEVKAFNHFSAAKYAEADALINTAVACGAQAVSLIPANDGSVSNRADVQTKLREAMTALKPLLDAHRLVGLIEPLGFEASTLRYKADVVEAIEDLGTGDTFKIVHDTFHHHIAQDNEIFPEYTGVVHISGVIDPTAATHDLRDEHRVLVDHHDQLNNIEQLTVFTSAGYSGPVSTEAFSPEVHAYTDPVAQLRGSFDFISTAVKSEPALRAV